jgi:hypothetical protein
MEIFETATWRYIISSLEYINFEESTLPFLQNWRYLEVLKLGNEKCNLGHNSISRKAVKSILKSNLQFLK